MKQQAKVTLIKFDKITVIKWLRENMSLDLSEIVDILKKQEVDFFDNYQLAVIFFQHIHIPGTIARLEIDYTYDMSGIPDESIH